MRSITLVAVLLALASAACGGRHLIKDYGDSYQKAFAAQAQRTGARKPAEAVVGLDSQEAAIAADNYRATLLPKGEKAEQEPVILLAPPSRERREPLAPSVPKE